MPTRELWKLEVGDQFKVFWAKDDDLRNIRCNYELQTIAEVKEDYILTKEGYEWYKNEDPDPDDNMLDTSRGYAYFYYP